MPAFFHVPPPSPPSQERKISVIDFRPQIAHAHTPRVYMYGQLQCAFEICHDAVRCVYGVYELCMCVYMDGIVTHARAMSDKKKKKKKKEGCQQLNESRMLFRTNEPIRNDKVLSLVRNGMMHGHPHAL